MTHKPARRSLLQRVRCLFGKHRRSAERARRQQGVWYSQCTGCGASMVKRGDETGWVLIPFQKRKRNAGGMKKRKRA